MDILKQKQYKEYSSISRYRTFPFYYHTEDKKFIYGTTQHLDTTTEYIAHKVQQTDNLDSLSLKYYGRPDLYWIIADFNRIQDPYINLIDTFKVIKIPSLSSIKFKE